jgi:cytosine/adenosine deaminase-related metal-dependent hydrolase
MKVVLGPDRDGHRAVFQDGRLVWEGSTIPPHTLTDGGFPSNDRAERITWLPCPEHRITHGFVNAHTHLYSGLFAYGVARPTPWPSELRAILERLWWRLDRALDAELLTIAARVVIAESLLSGTTTLIDHHESPSFIAGSLAILTDELERLGARGVVCYGATERNGGLREAHEGLDECERTIRRLRRSRVSTRIAGMVGLHAGFTVSDETLREAAALADLLDVGLHIHAAEGALDVEDARRRGYRGVVHRLDANLALGRKTILAHGVHCDPEEVALARSRGAWFVQNPRSNLNNGVGYPRHLVHARQVALGTDGFPAVMRDEVFCALEQGLPLGEPVGEPERRLALGLELASLHLSPEVREDRVAMGPAGAFHAVVAGRVVVREGRLVDLDHEGLREEARRLAGVLDLRMRQME